MARELASVLLCTEAGTKPCGTCRSCRAFSSGNHPDYREVGVPEGKQELPIALVQSVQDQAFVKPLLAPRRVFVVRDAERMNLAAANCFLKTLEEPPGGSCFVLIAAGLWDMPETIVSRCQIVRFTGLPAGDVEKALCSEGVEAADAWWLARRSWGSPGLARTFRDMDLHSVNRELAGKLLALGPDEVYKLTDWLSEQVAGAGSRARGRAEMQELLECMAVLYRDLAAVAVAPGQAEVFNAALEDQLRQFASRCSVESIIECADRVFEAIERVGVNANQQVALADMLTGLARATAGHTWKAR